MRAKLLAVLLAIVTLLPACKSEDANAANFNLSGVVLAAQAFPKRQSTPGPTAAPAQRALGALLINADAIPKSMSDCAFPVRQKGRRTLLLWDAGTTFSPSTLDDQPKALAGTRVAVEGRVERSKRNSRDCSLFAESVSRSAQPTSTP